MEEDLIAAALAFPALAALLKLRINWLTRPQGSALPASVLQKVSAPRAYAMEGRVGLTGHLVQISCYGATYAAAKAVANAWIAFLDTLTTAPFEGAQVENERDTFEAGDGPQGSAASINLFRTDVDARIWHAT